MEARDQGDPEKDGSTTGLLAGSWNYGGDAASAAGGSREAERKERSTLASPSFPLSRLQQCLSLVESS